MEWCGSEWRDDMRVNWVQLSTEIQVMQSRLFCWSLANNLISLIDSLLLCFGCVPLLWLSEEQDHCEWSIFFFICQTMSLGTGPVFPPIKYLQYIIFFTTCDLFLIILHSFISPCTHIFRLPLLRHLDGPLIYLVVCHISFVILINKFQFFFHHQDNSVFCYF